MTYQETVSHARDWIADVQTTFDYEDARDIVNHWNAARVVAAIQKHYAGGWAAFCRAGAPSKGEQQA